MGSFMWPSPMILCNSSKGDHALEALHEDGEIDRKKQSASLSMNKLEREPHWFFPKGNKFEDNRSRQNMWAGLGFNMEDTVGGNIILKPYFYPWFQHISCKISVKHKTNQAHIEPCHKRRGRFSSARERKQFFRLWFTTTRREKTTLSQPRL